MNRYFKAPLATAAFALISTLTLTTSAFSVNANPGIAPPNSVPYGASYALWGTAWWQWIFSLPARAPDGLPNPLFTDGAVDCSFGQSGQVWFLAGRICFTCNGVVTTAHRSCKVPTGTALFFPLLNGEADNIATTPALTLDQLKALAAQNAEASELHASIDGSPLANLFSYRAAFAPFRFTVPAIDNIFQLFGFSVPGTDWPNTSVFPVASDGYWLMVEPLPPGSHTINFGGTGAGGFQIDITYDLTVVPAGRF
jgi:hypothetical protein